MNPAGTSPKEIMHRWSAFLQTLLPSTHLYRVVSLATFSFALAQARHCHLSRISAQVPGLAHPASVLRRLKRLLQNPRLDVQAVCEEMAAWLSRWNAPSARLLLLLDETPHANSWRVVKVSLCYKRRALPLVWQTDAFAGRKQKEAVFNVVEGAAQLVARYCPQAQVVLLADRGLCWPALMDFCQKHDWHYVLRAQGHTRFVPDGTETGTGTGPAVELRSLVESQGQWFCGRGRAFAKAGWREVSVVVCWRHEAKEKWILVSDLKPTLHLTRWYARRMWHEQSFRDEKSHGFCWHLSQVRTKEAMHRLVLLLALAQLWLMRLGSVAQSPLWNPLLGLNTPANAKRYSLCRQGWMLLADCLQNQLKPPTNLAFAPP